MPRYPAGEPWRGGRVVFPHTTPDGHLVNLYGRAVGTAEQVPKAKRHDHLPGEKGYFNATALQAGDGGLWVCEGAFDALALLPLASRAWSRSLACRAGAGTGCARSASWSSPWTPMPPGSSSGASSLDRPRCGGSGWRCCRQPPNGGYKDVNEAWAELVAMMVMHYPRTFSTDLDVLYCQTRDQLLWGVATPQKAMTATAGNSRQM